MKVIALLVVCVVLAAGLAGVLALYLSKGNSTSDLQAQITQKDNTISSLQESIANLQAQVTQNANASATQIANLNEQLAALNQQTSSYFNIAVLNASDTLAYQQAITQDANATTQLFSDAIYYAGYVVIQATAAANTTFAEVNYIFSGSDFDYSKVIGTSGTAIFPVLPGTLTINIGNTNQQSANNATVTATYYY